VSGDYIMAVKSIGLSTVNGRKPCTLEAAAKHNKRELAAELEGRGRIDPDRVKLNYSLGGAGNVAGVLALASQLMEGIGTSPDKMRRDYCQAVEIVFSLPPTTTIDTAQYFADCVAWCCERFGAGNILSADAHHDEPSSPFHAHVLIAPIQAGRWIGGGLIDRTNTQNMRESFGRDVAAVYGLHMGDRLTGKRKGEAVAMVLANIEANHRAVIASSLWQPLRQAIERNPAPFIVSLGLELADRPPAKQRTKAQIHISHNTRSKRETLHLRKPNPIGIAPSPKPANPIGIDGKVTGMTLAISNPIGIENEAEKRQSLSCVGIAPKARVLSKSLPTDSPNPREDGRTVERDFDAPDPDHHPEPIQTSRRNFARVVVDDDGVIRERDYCQHQPDGYDQPGANW
jgi:hypothetical protein